jgi:hypothetical protein
MRKATGIALLTFLLFLGAAGGATKIVNSLWTNANDPCFGYAICR